MGVINGSNSNTIAENNALTSFATDACVWRAPLLLSEDWEVFRFEKHHPFISQST